MSCKADHVTSSGVLLPYAPYQWAQVWSNHEKKNQIQGQNRRFSMSRIFKCWHFKTLFEVVLPGSSYATVLRLSTSYLTEHCIGELVTKITSRRWTFALCSSGSPCIRGVWGSLVWRNSVAPPFVENPWTNARDFLGYFCELLGTKFGLNAISPLESMSYFEWVIKWRTENTSSVILKLSSQRQWYVKCIQEDFTAVFAQFWLDTAVSLIALIDENQAVNLKKRFNAE